MHIYSFQNKIKNITAVVFILGSVTFLFAKEPAADLSTPKENIFSELQENAKQYRAKGLEFQNMGDLDSALSLYQKAVELDSSYAIAYNDLGIIYEAKGFIDRAEEAYLKAIKVGPNYLSPYSNLALLYENKRELQKAAFYWKKRAEIGLPDDPWTEKAKQRQKDIGSVLSDRPQEDLKEEQVVELLKDVTIRKSAQKKDNKELSQAKFEQAKRNFNRGDDVTALKQTIDAQQLDPSNAEIKEFEEKIQKQLLSK